MILTFFYIVKFYSSKYYKLLIKNSKSKEGIKLKQKFFFFKSDPLSSWEDPYQRLENLTVGGKGKMSTIGTLCEA